MVRLTIPKRLTLTPMEDLATCDRCHDYTKSEYLIWITTEDFTPLEGENVPDTAYSTYDALCTNCYKSILE